jgi:hypothetical protein
MSEDEPVDPTNGREFVEPDLGDRRRDRHRLRCEPARRRGRRSDGFTGWAALLGLGCFPEPLVELALTAL